MFPVIPDFVVVPMAAVAGRRLFVPLAGCVAGMLAGGVATVAFSHSDPAGALALLHQLPLTHVERIGAVKTTLTAHGAVAFLYQPWSGVPFKTWAVAAGALQLSPHLVIPAFVLGRSFRVGLLCGIAGLGSAAIRGLVRDWAIPLCALYLALFGLGFWYVMG